MTVIYVMLVAHFVGDFVCQSDWMAINKSRSWFALAVHVIVYAFALASILLLAGWLIDWIAADGTEATWFVAINAVSHFAQDAATSRINARLWQANERHWFFVGIGADQLLHYVTLFVTAGWWLR